MRGLPGEGEIGGESVSISETFGEIPAENQSMQGTTL